MSLIARYTSPPRFTAKSRAKADTLDRIRRAKIARFGRHCQIHAPGCEKIEHGLHHLKKRSQGGEDSDENTLLACRHCNRWIERHPEEAARLGFNHTRKG